MKCKILTSLMGGALLFILSPALSLGIKAQVMDEARRGGGAHSVTSRGYSNGYNAGYNVGRRDGEAGERYDLGRHPEYNRRDAGYQPEYGAVADYQDSYRVGFEEGYQDGYNRLEKRENLEEPTSMRYRAAFGRGYQAGFDHGRRDNQTKKHYDFAHDRTYQDASLGYAPAQFASKEDYQYNFRQGYEAGYDDGYNNRTFSDQRNGQRTYTYRDRNEIRSSSHNRRRENEDSRYVSGGTFVVPEGTALRLQLNNTLSTRSNQNGDPFTAQVIDPVYIKDSVAIPAGSTVQGTVTRSIRPGRVEGKAEMNLRFDTITLPSDRSYKLNASVAGINTNNARGVNEEGTVSGRSSTGRDIGEVAVGSGIGAIIGAIAGGGKGAAIGAGVGAGAGIGAVLIQRGRDLDLPQGTEMTVKLNRPLELQR